MNRPSYNPPGVVKSPISLRLMPNELADLDAVAAASGISRSKLLRDAHLKGLPIIKSDLSLSAITTPTPSPVADLRGGESSDSPAVFSTPSA